jgi:predicted enzyme related to lactoylglutathione lyase
MAVRKLKAGATKKKPLAKKPTPKIVKKSAKPAAKKRPAPRSASRSARKSVQKPGRRSPAAGSPATTSAPARKAWLHPPVVHWEIMALDAPKQRAFFSDLFGWAIDANNPQNYGMVPSGGEGAIGGGIGPAPDSKPYVTFYVEVPDIDAALARAESLGASSVMPRTDMGMVILAQFRDPEGNLVGLIESSAP